jgi:hypothetical protein
MQTLLPVCIGFSLLISLSAQPEGPGDQCLGGTLISIQQDSITTKFNEKVQTYHLAPDAEIWRRGVDLASIRQLVVGDEIYLKCARAAGGEVVASIIAAVQKDSGIDLTPHHIREIQVCGGSLVAIGTDTLSMRNDKGVCVVHLKPDTEIWRGEIFHDTNALKLGDDVMARVIVGYPTEDLIADGEVYANLTKAEGPVVEMRPDRIVVNEGHWHQRVTVFFDRRTKFDTDEGALKKGVTVMAIGLELSRYKFRATSIVVEK